MLKSKWATKTKNPAINISSKRLWCVLVMNETSIFSGSHRIVNRCLAWFMESIKQQFTYVTFIFPHQLYRVPSTPYDTVINVCIYIECKEKTFSCGVWKKTPRLRRNNLSEIDLILWDRIGQYIYRATGQICTVRIYAWLDPWIPLTKYYIRIW